MATIQIKGVEAEQTYPLRQAVLRPHQELSETALPGDHSPGAAHFAAIDRDGSPLGVVSVLLEPAPGEQSAAWRLRGMAVAQDQRGQGVGSALFAAVVARVASQGGGLLWCAARLSAEGFYLRHGMERIGSEWDEPFIGRHVAMALRVPPEQLTGSSEQH